MMRAEIRKIAGYRFLWILMAVLLVLNFLLCMESASQPEPTQPREQTRYLAAVESVIDGAYRNLSEFTAMGIGTDAYPYAYQIRVISLYEYAKESVTMPTEPITGWQAYFEYDAVNIFIFVMLIAVSAFVFTQEEKSGFMAILRTTHGGRTKTAFAKIAALLLMSTAVVLIFTAETWIIFAARVGFSDADVPLQALPFFTRTPYVWSVGEYLAVTVIGKMAAGMIFSVAVAAISLFVYNYPLIYAGGMGIFGANYLLYALQYQDSEHPLKHLNLLALATGNTLVQRYRALNVFGNVVGYIPFLLSMILVLFVILSGIILFKFHGGGHAVQIPWLNRAAAAIRRGIDMMCQKSYARRGIRIRPSGFLGTEMRKLLLSTRMIWVLAALLLLKGYLSVQLYTPPQSYTDAVYREYMDALAGPMTEEKRQYLSDERAQINEYMDRASEMERAYYAEEITRREYTEFVQEYNRMTAREAVFALVEDRADFIDAMAAEGYEAWFVYDTGWKTLFLTGFDWTLYAAILVLFSATFAVEYTSQTSGGGFAQILRTTKHGRERTSRSKYMAAILLSAALAAVWNAIDAARIFSVYHMPMWGAPAASVNQITGAGHWTILHLLLAVYGLRIVACVLLALLLAAFSCIMKKSISAIAAVAALTLVPALLAGLGVTAFFRMDYISFMRVTEMMLQGEYGNYLAVAGIACAGTLACAERMWRR
ncbi:MAG: hypothetical protein IJ281_04605 [Clostridia bacterium]|nr:hypothetical protein [Clostridia bacterium]